MLSVSKVLGKGQFLPRSDQCCADLPRQRSLPPEHLVENRKQRQVNRQETLQVCCVSDMPQQRGRTSPIRGPRKASEAEVSVDETCGPDPWAAVSSAFCSLPSLQEVAEPTLEVPHKPEPLTGESTSEDLDWEF